MFVCMYVMLCRFSLYVWVCAHMGVCHVGVLCVPLLIEARGHLCSLDALRLVFVFYIYSVCVCVCVRACVFVSVLGWGVMCEIDE